MDGMVGISIAHMIEGLPVDISTRIRKEACMMELRDSFETYSELTFAARSLWFVIRTRLLDGLEDARADRAHDMLMYMRSELGLAYGCGPRLNHFRVVMDYLGDVAWGRAAMTREGLLGSGTEGQSSAADFCRLADLANAYYVGARWHVIDAGYTSDDSDDDDRAPPEPPKHATTDDEIYRCLLSRRVGFHIC
jgi:hypothetical protein